MSQVNVIDSIVITNETDTSIVYAEWSALDPDITVHGELTSGYAVKLFLNWSDQNGTIDLQTGDYFTFVVPEVFNQNNITNITDGVIMTPTGDVIATYSIDDNSNNRKEVKITFTDFVESHTDISGNFWLLLFVGSVDSTQEKTIEFEINGDVVASGEVTVNPSENNLTPRNEKSGYWVEGYIYNGYYIFNWIVYFNMEEDPINGFRWVENFSFEDTIPEDSPHVFLTDEIRQELGILPNQFPRRVGEYTKADSEPPANRYPLFKYQYNATDGSSWRLNYAPLINGHTTVGIDGTDGLNLSNLVFNEKVFSANLGTLTRPTAVQYCTIATIKLDESALGDPEVVKLFSNTFKASSGEQLNSSLNVHLFESGGQGLAGAYGFAFTKVDELGAVIPGARFSLYTSENFELGANRFVHSDDDGIVAFNNLPAGVYYIKETVTPSGYIPNETIYKVVLTSSGFEIYYGDNFDNRLDDNEIVNTSKSEVQPVSVELTAIKNLTGRVLDSGMFNFVVRDSGGAIVATGTNDAAGNIKFSEITFDSTGEYIFTVEEVSGGYSGITYDSSKFTVTVAVTDGGDGTLKTNVYYPNGGVVFNNSYAETSVKPCQCYAQTTKCRKSIEGKKIWVDNDNAGDTRPPFVEIILLRDNEVYQRIDVDSAGDGTFIFCCVPIWKNSSHKYNYQIDEVVPDGYTKAIEGYNVINTVN